MASCRDCKNCIHYSLCNYEEICHYDIDNIKNAKDCSFFKDRSRFVELPIKPGEKIFYYNTAGRIYESTVTQLIYGATGFLIDSDVMFTSNLIGERFFLTREEAEAAIKERVENANQNDT